MSDLNHSLSSNKRMKRLRSNIQDVSGSQHNFRLEIEYVGQTGGMKDLKAG